MTIHPYKPTSPSHEKCLLVDCQKCGSQFSTRKRPDRAAPKYCSPVCKNIILLDRRWAQYRANFTEHFWSKVNKSNGPYACWEWMGPTVRGYGSIKFNSRSAYAHRIAYKLANGEIPDSLNILHRCDNPPCCNPAHLWAGTHVDNMADMVAKGRQSKGLSHWRKMRATMSAHHEA